MQLTLAKPCPEAAAVMLGTPAESAQTRRWYAAYTLPRHEKKIAEDLPERGVEIFCPVYRSGRTWNGRRATVEMPLFAGYVFVHIALAERITVLQHPGVLRFVCCAGKPAAI